MTPGLRRAGWALVGLYVAVAAATPGRPLFDGFAPPAPYRWVKPPPETAAGNQRPESAERNVPLGEQGSEATNASTPDAQVIVTLPTGAIPARPPDTTVTLRLTPHDAATLASVPAPLRVVSNAYQLTLVYQPSGTPVAQLGANASIALTAASQGDGLHFSADGTRWQGVPGVRPFGATHGMVGPVQGDGYYVVTASPAVSATTTTHASAGPDGGRDSGRAVAVAAVAAAAVAGVVAAGFLIRSRRQERERERQQRERRRRAQARKKRPPPRKRRT